MLRTLAISAVLLWGGTAHAFNACQWFPMLCYPTPPPIATVVPTRTPTRVVIPPTATRGIPTATPKLGATNCCTTHPGRGCDNPTMQAGVCSYNIATNNECCWGYGWSQHCVDVATLDGYCPQNVPPESFTAICQQAEPMQALPEVMTALYQVLACLNANDPAHGLWTDTISATARVDYLPTKECPQWNPPDLCCQNIWQNYCNFACDGLYTCDKGNGPTQCRVSGLTSLHDCASGTVIVLSETCTQLDGVTPANSPLKYELINALTGGAHDQTAWWGWACS